MSGPASDWGFGSRTGVWINVVVQSALLLAVLVVLNLIVRGNNVRWDMTSRQAFTLTNETEDILSRLGYDVEIWIVSPEYSLSVDKSVPLAFQKTVEVLNEFRLRSGRITFHVVTEADNAQLNRIRNVFKTVQANTVYILAKLGDEKTNKRSVSLFHLFEGDPGTGELTSYRGQEMLAAAVAQLASGEKRVVYEITGHQEAFTLSHRAMAFLREYMTSLEAIEFRPLDTSEARDIPEDADLVLVLGPGQAFLPKEIDMLRRYVDRGGRLFVALQPRAKVNLDSFLEEHGVRAGDNLVHDARASAPGKPTFLNIRDFNQHEINRGMGNVTLFFWDSCTVEPIDTMDPDVFTVTPLIRTGPHAWAETSPPGAQPRPRPDAAEPRGSLPLTVAVEKKTGKDGGVARLLVWGSVVSLTSPVMSRSDLQVDYTVNQFRWLLDRDTMRIEGKKQSLLPVEATGDDLSRIRWIVLAVFPGLAVGVGILVWYLRRK